MSEIYGVVYCAIFPNEKKYIGQTTKKLQKRITEHKHHSKYDEKRYLYINIKSRTTIYDIIKNRIWREDV